MLTREYKLIWQHKSWYVEKYHKCNVAIKSAVFHIIYISMKQNQAQMLTSENKKWILQHKSGYVEEYDRCNKADKSVVFHIIWIPIKNNKV